MKHCSKVFIAISCILALSFAACAGSPEAASGSHTFSEIAGVEWTLSQVVKPSGTTGIENPGTKPVFTLKFDNGTASGVGAPNRFTGPYTQSGGDGLSFGMFAATKMAGLNAPKGLTEDEYFAILSKVKSWALNNGKLELRGPDTTLVFAKQ